ncbi:hypothetical protein BLNAU_17124 [Blattamonas nauphoetae]|uniref:Uncharacterized protein n=1 Tax=Blattamonas nauphoetae TaxID=2049346 RepID=A0ABQ9X9H7_9EUKA|nr:hypothetical protein BLNAU_17124 [Blattamonas nauphoetae]
MIVARQPCSDVKRRLTELKSDILQPQMILRSRTIQPKRYPESNLTDHTFTHTSHPSSQSQYGWCVLLLSLRFVLLVLRMILLCRRNQQRRYPESRRTDHPDQPTLNSMRLEEADLSLEDRSWEIFFGNVHS